MCHLDLLYSLVVLYTVQRLIAAAAPAVVPWRPARRAAPAAGPARNFDTPPAAGPARDLDMSPEAAESDRDRVGVMGQLRPDPPDRSHTLPPTVGQLITGAAPPRRRPAWPAGRRPGAERRLTLHRSALGTGVGEGSEPGPAAGEGERTGVGTETTRRTSC